MREIIIVCCVVWAAIGIASLRGEFSEIEKEIQRIEAKTERMQADPRPKYVEPQR